MRIIGGNSRQITAYRIGRQRLTVRPYHLGGISLGQHLLIQILIKGREFLLTAAPVIFQRTTSPFTLELCLSLRYSLRVIEIERRSTGRVRQDNSVGFRTGTVDSSAFRFLLGQISLLLSQGFRLFLLFLYLLNLLIDNR